MRHGDCEHSLRARIVGSSQHLSEILAFGKTIEHRLFAQPPLIAIVVDISVTFL
jgi:hypothetical protein